MRRIHFQYLPRLLRSHVCRKVILLALWYYWILIFGEPSPCYYMLPSTGMWGSIGQIVPPSASVGLEWTLCRVVGVDVERMQVSMRQSKAVVKVGLMKEYFKRPRSQPWTPRNSFPGKYRPLWSSWGALMYIRLSLARYRQLFRLPNH